MIARSVHGRRKLLAISVCLSAAVGVLAVQAFGSFGKATPYDVGHTPYSVAVGNFNGDARADLAVANLNSNDVSVLLGKGNGSFARARGFAAGSRPISVAVGNFNDDTRPDLAVANNSGPGGVSILLGKGDGSFGAATSFPVGEGTYPTSVAVGDLNGDHRPDLALADYFGRADSVSVLLGKGAGAFGTARRFAVGFSPIAVAVGNLNGDSHPDLAVANYDSGDVTVLLGDGAGSFGGKRSFGVGGRGRPTAVTIGKLNAGTDPDLAVTTSSSDRVWVLLNAGPSPRKLTLAYRRGSHRFTGRLSSADPACIRGQRVTVLRRLRGPDRQIGSAISTANGAYRIARTASPGTYYARVRAWSACRAERSRAIDIR